MAALSLALILMDIYNDNINYITEHTILGGIVCILFFTMCNYGYEMVNWVLLCIIPIYIFLRWLLSSPYKDEDYECDECKKPKKTCGCQNEKMPKVTCPAKPISLGTKCGVSRAT